MNNANFLERLFSDGIPTSLLIAVTVVLAILIRTIGAVVKSVAREKTRREIAAYIAEGTMSPDQGERLMKVGREET